MLRAPVVALKFAEFKEQQFDQGMEDGRRQRAERQRDDLALKEPDNLDHGQTTFHGLYGFYTSYYQR